jgi:predicted metal-binding protein
MTRAAVLYCKRIKDESCIACAKCYKAMQKGDGEFGKFDSIELVAMTNCGDCPGLVIPKVKLLKATVSQLERDFDVLFLGTCVKLAIETASCPIDPDSLIPMLESKFGVKIVLGTHNY